MKNFNKFLTVGIASCLLFASAIGAEARGGGFAGGGGRRFFLHSPYLGNGYTGRTGRAVGGYTSGHGGYFGGRRFGPGAAFLGLGAIGALGYGAYNYGGDYGYGDLSSPYQDACTRATGNPYRCNDEFGY